MQPLPPAEPRPILPNEMSALAEAFESEIPRAEDRYQRMAEAIIRRYRVARGSEADGWASYAERVSEAMRAGESLLPLVEEGFWQVLFFESERMQMNGPPQTDEEWARMVVFTSPEEIRDRAKLDRH